ncbi:MAG: 16S rRNA methyltransferase [Desulfurococcales archaeon ex4484_217_2]|nr:MAG: 16S rRNA methyltransferase [Desulfurococcales archaeon ex4484_217_2]
MLLNRFFNYDDELFKAIKKVYGDVIYDFLRAIREPGRRLYVRVNTLVESIGEVVDSLRERGISVFKDEHVEEAIFFPIKGPFKVPIEDGIIIVDKRTAESVYLGSHVYAPGVLKAVGHVRKNSPVTVVSPLLEPIGWGYFRIDPGDVGKVRRGLVVEVAVSRFKAPKIREFPEFAEGALYEQSLPAMLVSKILDPQPSELIVDMCAAPGGKASHIYQLTEGKARILAFDHSKKRIAKMTREFRRMKVNIEVHLADSRYLHVDYPSLRGKVDRILIDPPCSSLGVRPKLYDSKRYKDIIDLRKYQIQFFKPAYELLRKGGVLVYSTCTVTLEENEEVVEEAVERYGFELVEVKYGSLGSKGLGDKGDFFMRFHPHIHDVTGYFIAKLIKK